MCGGGVVAGCVTSGDDGPVAGDLLIRNTDSEAHTVAVTAEKTSTDDDAVPPERTAAAPAATPLRERSGEYRVTSDDRTVVSEFLREPGAFFVRVRIEGGDHTARGWIGLYEASGGGVAEEYLDVSISEGDRLRLSAQVAGA